MSFSTVRYSYPHLISSVVLDLSKLRIYEGYDLLKANFPGSGLILCQTDSLMISIKDPNRQFVNTLKTVNAVF